jgi:phage host-nuclease inhibitor protein Gam
MTEDPSGPGSVLDRQIESFQFRIQQTLSLHDDELDRLSSHLNTVKSEILDAKERIQELTREIEDARELKSGDGKRRNATLSAAVAKSRALHHQRLQEIQTAQTADIDAEQRVFESGMDDIKAYSRGKRSDATAEIEREIAKIQARIESYREATAKLVDLDETISGDLVQDLQIIDQGVIEELQSVVRQRNQERFNNLQQSKDKLAECVTVLDEMSRSHSLEVADRRRNLRDIQQKYEANLAKIEEHHGPRMTRLQQQLSDVQKRHQVLLRAAHHLEQSNQRGLKETITRLDSMKRQCLMTTDAPLLQKGDLAALEARKKEVAHWTSLLLNQNDRLQAARRDNETLKRDLWRLQHELRFPS